MKIVVPPLSPIPVPLPYCDVCARDFRLVGIECDIANFARDIHTFECAECCDLQTRTTIRGLIQ